jgi:gluconolactonase
MRLPGPSEVLPGKPAAVVDLQTDGGAALVGGRWRYADAAIREVDFTDVAGHLGPGGTPNRTYDVVPHAQARDYDDAAWRVLAPEETMLRLGHGRVSFNWYRIEVEIPARVGDLDPTGMTAVFEVVLDDYAEVWVDGELPLALGTTGGQVVGGFNAPNRVVLTRDARPGQRFTLAVFGINGPISTSPENYIWMRSATLEFHPPAPSNGRVERVATGFEFTEGPVWSPDGALLFSSPNTNAIYRWTPDGSVNVFRPKSGYSGVDIGRYAQPGSNGLAFDPQGRLTICQHGNRRVLRVEPHGNTTVLADRYEGRRLNSPNDLVYRSDGTLYFTDPPFGLPQMSDDPDRELPFSGVFAVHPDGAIELVDDLLAGPNGIALSPDERFLYVGNWDPQAKVVVRYELATGARNVLFDMTSAPGDDAIDGLKVDPEGRLYVCGPGGIWVLSPEGEHLETIELPEAPHNLAWGDDDGRTLYVTALSSIYRIRRN